MGIGYFGTSSESSCDPATYQTPDVEIAPLAANATLITRSLDSHSPSTNTPTAAALSGAINHAVAWKGAHAGHSVAVVLVTDGQPNACTGVDVATVAGAGLAGAGIPTYVVGVISPGQPCVFDPNPPNQADLDRVAAAGGTMRALMVDVTNNALARFQAALQQIQASSCQVLLAQ